MTGERCDGSIRCPASEHGEGCFTGEGHPDALRALRAPSEEAHLREQLAEAVDRIEDLEGALAWALAYIDRPDDVNAEEQENYDGAERVLGERNG